MVPYLRVANVLDGWIDYSDVYSMHFAEADHKKYTLRRGDILLNEGQSTELVGRSAIYDGPENRYCYQNSLVNFRCTPEVDFMFARAVFKHWLDIGHFKSIVKQTTSMAHLGGTRFANLFFPLPGLSEQRQVAKILDTLGEAIRKTEQIIAKLKQVKQGLLHDLLTRGIDDNGELRDPLRHPEQFRDSAIGRIPVGWNVSRVDGLLSDVDPATRSGPFGSALLKSELVEDGVPLLGIDNVHVEKFVPEYSRFVTARKAAELHRYRVRPNDVMITIMGTVGRCCLVPPSIGDALSSKHVWTISFNDAVYLPTLACLQFNYAPWVLRHFSRDEQGGIMSAIRAETLRSTLLPVPPRAEATVIEHVLVAASQRIDREEAVAAKLKLVRHGLADDLLTGRVRVRTDRLTLSRSEPPQVQLGLEL